MTIGFNPGAGGTQRLTPAARPGPGAGDDARGPDADAAPKRRGRARQPRCCPPTARGRGDRHGAAAGAPLGGRDPRASSASVYEGAAGTRCEQGLAAERKWFMSEAGLEPVAAGDGGVRGRGRAPRRLALGDAEGIAPLAAGTATGEEPRAQPELATPVRARPRDAPDHGAHQRRGLREASRRSSRSIQKPAAASRSPVARFGWQPPAIQPQGRSSRSCQRASRGSPRTCSRKSSCAALDQDAARLRERAASGPRPCRGRASRRRCRSCRRRREGPRRGPRSPRSSAPAAPRREPLPQALAPCAGRARRAPAR